MSWRLIAGRLQTPVRPRDLTAAWADCQERRRSDASSDPPEARCRLHCALARHQHGDRPFARAHPWASGRDRSAWSSKASRKALPWAVPVVGRPQDAAILGLEHDAAVHDHDRRACGGQGAARFDGLVERGGRDDDDVGSLADGETAAVGLARGESPGRRTRRGSRAPGSAPRSARTAACRPASGDPRGGRPARSRATDRRARPAHRCRTRGRRLSRRSIATCSRSSRLACPTACGPARRRCRDGQAGRSRRSLRRRTCRDRPGRGAGRARVRA